MDILSNKYISEDEIRTIALKTDPRDIFSFCSLNKKTAKVCRSKAFWSDFVAGSQSRYIKLATRAVVEGREAFWRQLWLHSVPEGVVAEPRLLMDFFGSTVRRGYEQFS